ncbi:MAG: serine/threonine protein kinase [Myxococcales bacterium]|nr:serine/threonine protein kinase [Myxococcales bacterium]
MIDDPTAPGGDGAATVAAGSGSSGASLPVTAGDRFGRFRVDGMLGAGGMGVVFAAHDPVLDRPVAIKVMAQLADDTAAAAVEARLVREAKAMARLTHPNVVRVYEAGATRAGVFLVMELIEGTTLARWLDAPRSWREVIARFVAAGRGLAAAHAAGMVHRDFKPANVLLGHDGRVLVTDFGLVSVGTSVDDTTPAPPPLDDGGDLSSGRVVGTPRYMAPEQHQRGAIDHRTDQWSFCAALWEGLYGAHPFAAETLEILTMRVCVDDVAPPADERGVPTRIRAALTRGLARDAEARFPSMAALLAELERDPGRTTRRLLMIGGAVGLVGLAAFGWLREPARPARRGLCAGLTAPTWTPAERAAIAAQFRAVRGAAGDDVFARAAARLDGYGAHWHEIQAGVCHTDDRRSAEFLERIGCLARLKAEGAALLAVLSTRASAEVVDGAVAAVASLPAVETCLDPRQRGARTVALSPEQRVAMAAVEGQLQRSDALFRAGLFAEALTEARAAAAAATAMGDPGVEAQARLALGRALDRTGALVESERELRAAAQRAASAGADPTMAGAWVALMWVLAQSERAAESLTLAPLIEGAIERIGNPPRLRADYTFYQAVALIELGRYEAAVPVLERALAIWTELDPSDLAVARVLNTMANVAAYRGRSDDAVALYTRALAQSEAALGPDHPDVAKVLANLADAELERGGAASSLARCQHAVAIYRATPGADPRSSEHAGRCVGVALHQLGRLDEARATLAEAVAVGERGQPPSGFLPYTLTALAAVEAELGDPAAALALADRALALHNPSDRHKATAVRGGALVDLGRGAAARPELEAALADFTGGADDRAALEFALARALWTDRRTRPRARGLAEAARQRYADVGQARARAAVDAWLRARP